MPHAGYVYSGQTAVTTALAAAAGKYKKALILAPSHYFRFEGICCCNFSSYKTPFGDLKVDLDATEKIRESLPELCPGNDDVHSQEHSLEVELPILQNILNIKNIIPIICGSINVASARTVAKALRPFYQEDILWIISSDFTHYGDSFLYTPFQGDNDFRKRISELDFQAINLIKEKNLEKFEDFLYKTKATICGRDAIKILLALLEGKQKTTASLIKYTSSGEITGDYSNTVSYAGICFGEN